MLGPVGALAEDLQVSRVDSRVMRGTGIFTARLSHRYVVLLLEHLTTRTSYY